MVLYTYKNYHLLWCDIVIDCESICGLFRLLVQNYTFMQSKLNDDCSFFDYQCSSIASSDTVMSSCHLFEHTITNVSVMITVFIGVIALIRVFSIVYKFGVQYYSIIFFFFKFWKLDIAILS